MNDSMVAAIIEALIKDLGPLLVGIVGDIIKGADPLSALDHERVREILSADSKLALAMELDRLRRGGPVDDPNAPSAPSAK